MKRGATTAAGILLATAAIPAVAQRGTVIQTETRLVEVDVVATGKKGDFVSNLRAQDFHVWEDNREQAIKSFSFGPQPDTGANRYLILFFDSLHLSPADMARARLLANRLIDKAAGPNRPMSVVVFDNGLRIARDFTGDKEKLTGALQTIGVASQGDTNSPGLLVQSMSRMARDLNSARGPKTLVWFSAAFTAQVNTEFDAMLSALNRSDTSVFPVDVSGKADGFVSGPAFDASDDTAPAGGRGGGRRGGGGRGGGRGGAQESEAALAATGSSNQILATLADRTGGMLITDLLSGLDRIAEAQDRAYVIAYTPPPSAEGACHTIKVKVDRPGITLRSRNAWCNAAASDLLAGSPVERQLEARATDPKPGNLTGEMQIPFFYTPAGTARVNVAIEIPPVKNGAKGHAGMHILGVAYTPDGSVSARFSDIAALDAGDRPYHYENQFEIAPGQYTFRVVFSEGRGNFGKLEMPLNIEPWQPGQFGMSAIALSTQLKPAPQTDLDLLSGNGGRLISNGVQVIPSGTTRFARTQSAAAYFEIYQSAPPALVGIKVFDGKTGEVKIDTGLRRAEGPGPVLNLAMKIPVGDLPAGSYRMEVTATNKAAKPIARSVEFDVRGSDAR